jgi:hypothetical protein
LAVTVPQEQEQPVVPYPGGKRTAPPEPQTPNKSIRNISLEIEIVENDLRARQFACCLTVKNQTKHAVNILAINYRLGSGVWMEKTENTSSVDLKMEYDQLKTDLKYLFRSLYINNSRSFRDEFAKNYLESLRSQFQFKNLLMIYYYLVTGQLRVYAQQMSQIIQRMDFPVTSAQAARDVLSKLDNTIMTDLASAKIKRMNEIEQIDPNFLKAEYVAQVQPGEIFQQVFVLKARRKLSSIASYTAAFVVKLSADAIDGGRPIERMLSRSTSIDVTPSPITLSAFAVVFSFFGAVLNNIGLQVISTSKGNGPQSTGTLSDALSSFLSIDFLRNSLVAAILAIVLYNSFEMTEFRERVKFVSWRSAMFIGLLCGLLSDRMLRALESFMGSARALGN